MARNPIEIRVTTSGFFFTGHVSGQIHRDIYTSLKEVATVGASAAAGQLHEGHGLLPYAHRVSVAAHRSYEVPAAALQRSIEPRLDYAGRFPVFRGLAYVVEGARGFAPVRLYGRKQERRFHYMLNAGRAAESYATAQAGRFAARIAAGLSR